MHLIISSSLNPASRSVTLARRLAGVFQERDIAHELIDVRERTLPLCDADSCYQHPHVQSLSSAIDRADSVTIATPIYNFEVGPSARNIVAVSGKALTGKVVGLMCAAGGQGSYMAVMGLANTLMLDFRTIIIPRFVFAAAGAFDGAEITDTDVLARIDELAGELHRFGGLLAPADRSC